MQGRNPVIELIRAVNGPGFSDTLTVISGTNRIKEGLIWSSILLLVGGIIYYFAGLGMVGAICYVILSQFLVINMIKIYIGISMLMTAYKERKHTCTQ